MSNELNNVVNKIIKFLIKLKIRTKTIQNNCIKWLKIYVLYKCN